MPDQPRIPATIFYAWQSDTPNRTNRSFIEKALHAALKRLHADATLELAEREIELALDADTRGVPGSPPIAATILDKISKCTAFVADLTFTGHSLPNLTEAARLFPNPNVLLEYGYALKTHGPLRLIGVLNTAYGTPPHLEKLPFDLKHLRKPVEYRLAPDNPATSREIFDELVRQLTSHLRLLLKPEVDAIPRVRSSSAFFQPVSFPDVTAYFRKVGELIPEPVFGEGALEVDLPENPPACLRLYPHKKVTPLKSEMFAKNLAMQGDLHPMGLELDGRNWSRNALGAIAYAGPQDPPAPLGLVRPGVVQRPKLRNFTQLFTSSEICGVDYGVIGRVRGHGEKGEFGFKLMSIYRFELSCTTALTDFLRFSRQSLKHPLPLRVEANVRGIKGGKLGLGDSRKGNALKDEIAWFGDIANHDVEPAEFLRPFFDEVWETFGVERSGDAQVRLLASLRTT